MERRDGSFTGGMILIVFISEGGCHPPSSPLNSSTGLREHYHKVRLFNVLRNTDKKRKTQALQASLNMLNVQVHDIRRRLNKENRRDWGSNVHLSKPKDFWNNVPWTDEAGVEPFGFNAQKPKRSRSTETSWCMCHQLVVCHGCHSRCHTRRWRGDEMGLGSFIWPWALLRSPQMVSYSGTSEMTLTMKRSPAEPVPPTTGITTILSSCIWCLLETTPIRTYTVQLKMLDLRTTSRSESCS